MSESSKVQTLANIKEEQASLPTQFSLAMLLHWMLMLLLLGSSQGKAMNNHFSMRAPSFLSTHFSNYAKSDVEDKTKIEDEIEGMIQSVQRENMKPIQGTWYWNPLNMTFMWSIQRPIGGSDRYTLAFNHEGIEFDKEEGFENPRESEENNLENFVFGSETEEVLGSPTGTK